VRIGSRYQAQWMARLFLLVILGSAGAAAPSASESVRQVEMCRVSVLPGEGNRFGVDSITVACTRRSPVRTKDMALGSPARYDRTVGPAALTKAVP
jgi:hypothetical protein